MKIQNAIKQTELVNVRLQGFVIIVEVAYAVKRRLPMLIINALAKEQLVNIHVLSIRIAMDIFY